MYSLEVDIVTALFPGSYRQMTLKRKMVNVELGRKISKLRSFVMRMDKNCESVILGVHSFGTILAILIPV